MFRKVFTKQGWGDFVYTSPLPTFVIADNVLLYITVSAFRVCSECSTRFICDKGKRGLINGLRGRYGYGTYLG